MDFNWSKLQNGSDIRGVAVAGVEGEEVNLDNERIEQLGKAFYHWLRKKHKNEVGIAVGRDSRISGPELVESFSRGVSSQGGNVIDCGVASTPAMFMATMSTNLNTQAGVMLTASHLPYNRNGLKFFTAEGGLNKTDISEILALAAKEQYTDAPILGRLSETDFISEYAASIVEVIRKGVDHDTNFDTPLEGLKIIVDAGNGAGGFFADKILVPLGADVSGSQFLDPDGMFPNHIPNPENEEAMDSICNAVIANNADLGIIFDTDVDRAAVVDRDGMPINRNALIALISAIILEEHPGTTIVTDSITSKGLADFIEQKLKGKHHRFKRGYKNVINESIRLNEAGEESWIAIETSGHAALKENYFLDDGAFLVAKILVKVAQLHKQGKNISELISDLNHPLESVEYRLNILNQDFSVYGNMIIEKLKKLVAEEKNWEPEKNNFEGIRVRCTGTKESGWFLLRLSLHDPVMPLNIESDIEGGTNVIRVRLRKLLSDFDQLDTSTLN
ncbi:MAG: phosphomannomutase/phosphoglucomutase [Bacteroidales bacterium]|jgi:phosphomannomutase|nr:phosphomannomutase/phosphoglucomutase [Bacteroidales bacterium]